MAEKATIPIIAVFRRFGVFLRDFLPEKNLQFLFPIASLLLYVGASRPWLLAKHVLYSLQYQHQDGTLWFHLSTRLEMLRYEAILYAVTFSFIGSVALWCLPVRNTWRKFAVWVLVPGGLAIVSFLAIVLLSHTQPVSLLGSSHQVLREDLREFPARLLQLGRGFYISLIGIALLAASLCIGSVRRVPLPVRFRESMTIQQQPSSEFARNVFTLVVQPGHMGNTTYLRHR